MLSTGEHYRELGGDYFIQRTNPSAKAGVSPANLQGLSEDEVLQAGELVCKSSKSDEDVLRDLQVTYGMEPSPNGILVAIGATASFCPKYGVTSCGDFGSLPAPRLWPGRRS